VLIICKICITENDVDLASSKQLNCRSCNANLSLPQNGEGVVLDFEPEEENLLEGLAEALGSVFEERLGVPPSEGISLPQLGSLPVAQNTPTLPVLSPNNESNIFGELNLELELTENLASQDLRGSPQNEIETTRPSAQEDIRPAVPMPSSPSSNMDPSSAFSEALESLNPSDLTDTGSSSDAPTEASAAKESKEVEVDLEALSALATPSEKQSNDAQSSTLEPPHQEIPVFAGDLPETVPPSLSTPGNANQQIGQEETTNTGSSSPFTSQLQLPTPEEPQEAPEEPVTNLHLPANIPKISDAEAKRVKDTPVFSGPLPGMELIKTMQSDVEPKASSVSAPITQALTQEETQTNTEEETSKQAQKPTEPDVDQLRIDQHMEHVPFSDDDFPDTLEIQSTRSTSQRNLTLLLGLCGGLLLYQNSSNLLNIGGQDTFSPTPSQVGENQKLWSEGVEQPELLVPPPPQAINANTIAQLDHTQLLKAFDELTKVEANPNRRDLLHWALFRLAHTYGHVLAKDYLLAHVSPQSVDNRTLSFGAAASIGALFLGGKPVIAKKWGLRFFQQGFSNSPELAFVLGLAHRSQPAKALVYFNEALAHIPTWPEPSLSKLKYGSGDKLSDVQHRQAEKLLAELENPTHILSFHKLMLTKMAYGLSAQSAAKLIKYKSDDMYEEHLNAIRRVQIRHYILLGDFPRAQGLARENAKTNPKDIEAHFQYSSLLAATGQSSTEELMLPKLDQAQERPVDKGRLLLHRVLDALRQNETARAEALVEKSNSITEREFIRWREAALGAIAETQDDPSGALRHYSMASKSRFAVPYAQVKYALLSSDTLTQRKIKLTRFADSSTAFPIKQALAQVTLSLGDTENARDLLREVLWASPVVDEPLELAIALSLASSTGKSLEESGKDTLARLTGSKATAVATLRTKSQLAHQQGKLDEAVQILERLVEINADSVDDVFALAKRYLNQNKSTKALEIANRFAKNTAVKKNPMHLMVLAECWVDKEPMTARTYITASIKLLPSAEAYLLLGSIEAERGEKALAIEAYLKAVEIRPKHQQARLVLADALTSTGALREALRHYQESMKLGETNTQVLIKQGVILEELERFPDAVRVYQRVLVTQSKPSADILFKIGRIQLENLNQIALAIKTLNRVIKHQANHSEALYKLGYALKDVGRDKEARNVFNKLLATKPSSEIRDEIEQEVAGLSRRP
jgi:tetratricopeptide (TPR) repeat protein